MDTITRLNINHHGIPVPGFKGDNAIFEEIARLVGGDLPTAYIDFIRRADGGHPEAGCFLVPGDTPENIVEVDWFYSTANPAVDDIKSAIKTYSDLLGSGALPIGRDGGGNQFYILLSSQPQSVWIYLHDEGGKRIKLSECFEDFTSGLFLNPDYI